MCAPADVDIGFRAEHPNVVPVTAVLAFCVALCGGASASALPLKLFSTRFPACLPKQLVYGPQESIWFVLRACRGINGNEPRVVLRR
jgi:hypothetical protein